MMFGHDDQQQQQDSTLPAPDSTLDQGSTVSAPVPADETSAPEPIPAHTDDQPATYMTDDQDKAASVPAASNDGNLMHIKQQALSQLSPLLGHLDQTAEEKFRTLMMLIQASDNDKLIPQAYEAAQAITDEKARAQALLDVVNEINYFTQQAESAGL